MKTLDNCRDLIDSIDEKIIELYEERMNIVKEVINYKLKNNISVQDKNRENLMLQKNLKKIKNEEYKKYYKYILDGFLNASKDLQGDIKYNKE